MRRAQIYAAMATTTERRVLSSVVSRPAQRGVGTLGASGRRLRRLVGRQSRPAEDGAVGAARRPGA
jgi:hypothetical protein